MRTRQRAVERRGVERGDRCAPLQREGVVAPGGAARRGGEDAQVETRHRARRTSARATRSAEAGTASSRPSGRAASRVVLAHDRLHDPLEDTRLGKLLHRGCRSSCERAAKLVVRPAAGRWPPRSRGRHRPARGRRSRRRRPPRESRPPRSRSPASRPPAPRAACEGGSPRPTSRRPTSTARKSATTSSRVPAPRNRTRSAMPSAAACRSRVAPLRSVAQDEQLDAVDPRDGLERVAERLLGGEAPCRAQCEPVDAERRPRLLARRQRRERGRRIRDDRHPGRREPPAERDLAQVGARDDHPARMAERGGSAWRAARGPGARRDAPGTPRACRRTGPSAARARTPRRRRA